MSVYNIEKSYVETGHLEISASTSRHRHRHRYRRRHCKHFIFPFRIFCFLFLKTRTLFFLYTIMNIKHHWLAELQTISHHQLWIITSYRNCSIQKLNSSSKQKMDVRKYFVSECKYYIFILSVICVLQYLLYRTCT